PMFWWPAWPEEDAASFVIRFDRNVAPNHAGHQNIGWVDIRIARQINPPAEGAKFHLDRVAQALAHRNAHHVTGQYARIRRLAKLLTSLIGQRRAGAREARVPRPLLGRQRKLRPG